MFGILNQQCFVKKNDYYLKITNIETSKIDKSDALYKLDETFVLDYPNLEDYQEIISKLLNYLEIGWKIYSATGVQGGVHYILVKQESKQ